MKKLLPFLRSEHNQAIAALIIANIIWGSASPIFKLALTNITPFTLAFLRFFGAMFLLFPFAIRNLRIEKTDLPKIILLSFFGITLNVSFFFFGLRLAPSINAPIIASSGPVFLYLLSISLLHEKPHPKVLIGMIISLIGVLVIVSQPLIEKGFTGEVIGNLLFVVATFGTVIHAIFSKEVEAKYNPATVTFWSFAISSIMFLPFFIYEMIKYQPFSIIDYRGVTGLVFGIVFSSALGYFLFEWGLKKINAQEVGVFTYIDPIIAAIIAIPLLHEKLSTIFLLGSTLVFLGIFIAEKRLPWHPIHKYKKMK